MPMKLRVLNSNYQALSIEDLTELAVGLAAGGGCNPEYDRALAELLRDALALAGGPYIPDGPSLAFMVETVTGRKTIET